ncbi:MAG: hypothetical protein GY757_24905 [bacterium]|nr:hypothetical protein [bacterium]
MKVAVPVYKESLSPRLDISDGLVIYLLDKGIVKQRKTVNPFPEQPSQLIAALQKEEVTKIIVAGCPKYFLRILLFNKFEVLCSTSNSADKALHLFLDNKLDTLSPTSGNYCCNKQNRFQKGKHNE